MPPLPPLPPMPDFNQMFLEGLRPVVDVFWTAIWTAVSSSITPPPVPQL